MSLPSSTARIVTAATTLALVLGGCGSGGAPAGAPSGPAASPPAAAPGQKVSANTASEDELVAALTGAGVANPGRWAEEIEEYRPYPPDDPTLGKLRAELGKYNPGPETLDRIMSVLTP